jgi:hypothetical protein
LTLPRAKSDNIQGCGRMSVAIRLDPIVLLKHPSFPNPVTLVGAISLDRNCDRPLLQSGSIDISAAIHTSP